MLFYEDFTDRKSFETAVSAANEWIATRDIKILCIETLTDPSSTSGRGINHATQSGVRVWYQQAT